MVISEGGMSGDKKIAVETNLAEEEKLFEEKAVNPYIAEIGRAHV